MKRSVRFHLIWAFSSPSAKSKFDLCGDLVVDLCKLALETQSTTQVVVDKQLVSIQFLAFSYTPPYKLIDSSRETCLYGRAEKVKFKKVPTQLQL